LQLSAFAALKTAKLDEHWVKTEVIHRLALPNHPDLPLRAPIQAPIQ
jgi:hypothetical protein